MMLCPKWIFHRKKLQQTNKNNNNNNKNYSLSWVVGQKWASENGIGKAELCVSPGESTHWSLEWLPWLPLKPRIRSNMLVLTFKSFQIPRGHLTLLSLPFLHLCLRENWLNPSPTNISFCHRRQSLAKSVEVLMSYFHGYFPNKVFWRIYSAAEKVE